MAYKTKRSSGSMSYGARRARMQSAGDANGSAGMTRSSNTTGIMRNGGNIRMTFMRTQTGTGKMRSGKRRGVYQAGDTYCA